MFQITVTHHESSDGSVTVSFVNEHASIDAWSLSPESAMRCMAALVQGRKDSARGPFYLLDAGTEWEYLTVIPDGYRRAGTMRLDSLQEVSTEAASALARLVAIVTDTTEGK